MHRIVDQHKGYQHHNGRHHSEHHRQACQIGIHGVHHFIIRTGNALNSTHILKTFLDPGDVAFGTVCRFQSKRHLRTKRIHTEQFFQILSCVGGPFLKRFITADEPYGTGIRLPLYLVGQHTSLLISDAVRHYNVQLKFFLEPSGLVVGAQPYYGNDSTKYQHQRHRHDRSEMRCPERYLDLLVLILHTLLPGRYATDKGVFCFQMQN